MCVCVYIPVNPFSSYCDEAWFITNLYVSYATDAEQTPQDDGLSLAIAMGPDVALKE